MTDPRPPSSSERRKVRPRKHDLRKHGLRKHELRKHGGRFLKFGGVGVINTATDVAVYALGLALGLAPALANIAGFFTANVQSYLLNARFTFNTGRKGAPTSIKGYGRFFLAHAASLVLSTVIVLLLAPSTGPFAAKAVAIAATVVVNYAMSVVFVFGPAADRD